ncbi:hypothetical protein [Parasitella parasitica]|uniref:Zinc finger PHD-type domain-containing protein n=1 Tax=Parasitella parasitica TaxID=35722 RepID=A0A0B7MV49_9FUNG|nr:hypothetical protein [Parasitella parasitica]
MKTGASAKGLTSSSNVLSPQKTNAMVFSSIDNKPTSTPHKNHQFKKLQSIQPIKPKEACKENWNSHVFVSSPYDQLTVQHPSSTKAKRPIKLIPQTFTTNIRNEKIEKTTQRPTMGGKTIGSIQHLPANTGINHSNRMSSEELKLLSRRIDPHEPLASPHASPRKPPLPNIYRNNRKRSLQELIANTNIEAADDEENEPPTKKIRQFTCEPCKKVYKTRNGFIYHKQKCKKIIKFESSVIIECVCENPTDDTGTMIECTRCNKWLHLRCSNGVTKEDTYCCPRCNPTTLSLLNDGLQTELEQLVMATPCLVANDVSQLNQPNHENQEQDDENEEEEDYEEEEHIFNNGRVITLSALCEAKERGKNLFKTFQEAVIQEQDGETTKDEAGKNHFNFLNLFSEELGMEAGNSAVTVTVDSPTLPPSSIIADEDWNNGFNDFNSSDWCNDDVPSLLFSDNNPSSSFVDDFITSDIPSPTITHQADWLHFANFDFDFTSDIN